VTTNRPEWIRCIKHTHVYKQNTSWCGERLSNFDKPFQDIDHATYTVKNEGRLVPCPKCVDTIIGILKND
jgi:hypothetical protein